MICGDLVYEIKNFDGSGADHSIFTFLKEQMTLIIETDDISKAGSYDLIVEAHFTLKVT